MKPAAPMNTAPEIDKATPSGISIGEKWFRVPAFMSKYALVIKTYDPRAYPEQEKITVAIVDPCSELPVEVAEANAELICTAVNAYDHLRSQNQKLREACEVALPWVEANTVEACSGHGPNPSQCLECHLRANGQRLANKLRAALKEVE